MTAASTATDSPGLIGRIRSRQAGHPTGLLGRIVGRAMVKDTAAGNDRALGFLDLDSPRAVLEVGFGQGRTAAKLLGLGHRVYGVEVSQTMVAQARARNRKACAEGRAELVEGDGCHIPFADSSVDAAFTVHTIYFMAQAEAVLADVFRVLRPGGRFVIACRVGDDEMPAWMDPAVYRIPTVATVESWLTNAGFLLAAHQVGDEATHLTHWFVADRPA